MMTRAPYSTQSTDGQSTEWNGAAETTPMTPSTPALEPYLAGNYAPTHDEITATDLKVIGELPDDLAGVFVRNGSNPSFTPQGRYHWFDGDGMLHAVHFEAGRATYRNRWVRTRGLAAELEAGRP